MQSDQSSDKYTDAVHAERRAWRVYNAQGLSERERDAARSDWMAAARRTAQLADRLRVFAASTVSEHPRAVG